MGELDEGLWAVLSERGCEAAGLTYAEAGRIVRELAGKKISGLSIITSDAAGRITGMENLQYRQANPNGGRPKAKPRG